jgi:CxxC motif-containing protein (DUF1111 family)
MKAAACLLLPLWLTLVWPDAAMAADRLAAAVGKALFDRLWAPAPASTRATDGLGPLYNARSCAACHPRGGQASTPQVGPAGAGLVLRLPGDDPVLGRQLQTAAIPGQSAEGVVRIAYTEEPIHLRNGSVVRLRRPDYQIASAPPLPVVSARLAPSLHGIGLLAAVPAEALAALADPIDRDGDGIRGRLGRGRFGLRAQQPDLGRQVAEALLLDLGLSSPAQPFPAGDCTAAQAVCRAAPHGDREGAPGVEIDAEMVAALVAYIAALPPPRPREHEPAGERLLVDVGCAACHRPRLPVMTAQGKPGIVAPYTDLLLHDLGPGLADQGQLERAEARLWRTAPLWGVGRRAALLHDGRARSLIEAILWHGGEAEAARERFSGLAAAEREALLAFLAKL